MSSTEAINDTGWILERLSPKEPGSSGPSNENKFPLEAWLETHKNFEETDAIKKLLSFLSALQDIALKKQQQQNQNNNDAVTFSLDTLIQEINALLYSLEGMNGLTKTDIDELRRALIPSHAKDLRSLYANRSMLAFYFTFVGVSLIAAIAGYSSYGFGSSTGEAIISGFWNLWDTGASEVPSRNMVAREKTPTATINRVGEAAMLVSVLYTACALVMNNLQYAFMALGFGFAIGNFAAAVVEYRNAQNAQYRRNALFEELKNTIPQEHLNEPDIATLINRIDPSKRESKSSLEGVQNIAKLELALKKSGVPAENINRCSSVGEMFVIEDGRYKRSLEICYGLFVCGLAMTAGALISTGLIGVTHGLGSVLLPWMNTLFSTCSALVRLSIEADYNDLDNVKEALKQKNQLLGFNRDDKNDDLTKRPEAKPEITDKDIEAHITGQKSYKQKIGQMGQSLSEYFPRFTSSKRRKSEEEQESLLKKDSETDIDSSHHY